MAADSVAWTGENSTLKVPCTPKIRRPSPSRGGLAASPGSSAEIEHFWRWFQNDYEHTPIFSKDDGFNALWVRPDGTMWVSGHQLYFFQIYGDFYALGAGKVFMFGALYAKATAEEAVRLAILHTDGAGGPVQVEHLHPALAEAAE